MAAKTPKWQVAVLAVLALVAVVLVVTIWPRSAADIPASGQNRPRDPGTAPGADPAVPPPLGIDDMTAQRVAPANRRDLFRFGSAAPAPEDVDAGDPGEADPRPAPRSTEGEPEPAQPALEPAGPPPPPPIPLRYVGYAETPGSGKVAALSDGRFTYHGREGDVIEGRWRVVQIGVESLVIESVDGTGRQTLRLAGG
jgi:hypothetical protein